VPEDTCWRVSKIFCRKLSGSSKMSVIGFPVIRAEVRCSKPTVHSSTTIEGLKSTWRREDGAPPSLAMLVPVDSSNSWTRSHNADCGTRVSLDGFALMSSIAGIKTWPPFVATASATWLASFDLGCTSRSPSSSIPRM